MESARAQQDGPALPTGRGELSDGLLRALLGRPGARLPSGSVAGEALPYGEDLHLALYICYELHYRGFRGVDPDWEWNPELLRLRGELERLFLAALRADTARRTDADEAFAGILVERLDADGLTHFLRDEGELWQLREYAAQRSLYHLKEADPHAWVIPRLRGRAKAAMVAVEFDEFGGGRADRMHSRLFADLMSDLGLDTAYGRYVDAATAEMLASVNLMSMFGLRRSLRGALVGHFAAVEVTSSPASRRLAEAMRRADAGEAAVHFYAEHVEADAVHEQVVRREVVGGLLEEEPWLETDVAFGVDATDLLDTRLATETLASWRDGVSSLRTPL
ncbi:iron-containing redox enzyme family protein [Streptomyces sp. IB2014 016-6]|uniref:iron-containing redox enzyme family protein n=1 Tax=Streptomyces sp. IB2014 016-6 TaxID=2517818 RepID=UPI0011C7B49E|nr:iron-containing redox enzyme family protein [Streptomyces sp. IB2014 016-6]TXL89999.1 iron-containing redox enzyme family protein [Streptomyces sp. IB2014 016-6]